jgi:hypothetical protein
VVGLVIEAYGASAASSVDVEDLCRDACVVVGG